MRRRAELREPMGVLTALQLRHWQHLRALLPEHRVCPVHLVRKLGRVPTDEDLDEAEAVLAARRAEREAGR